MKKSSERNRFYMYKDWWDTFTSFNDVQLGKLTRAIFEYQVNNKEPDNQDIATVVAFSFLKPTFIRDAEEYDKTCEKKSEIANKRWHSEMQEDATACYSMQEDATACKRMLQHATACYSMQEDADIDIEIDIDKEKERVCEGTMFPPTEDISSVPLPKPESKNKRFVKPTLEEVQSYIAEKGYSVDAQMFIDFYESKGWLVGKSPMKDWRASLRTWSKRDKGHSQREEEKPDWHGVNPRDYFNS